MNIYHFFNDFNIWVNLKLTFCEELIIILLFYNFIKIIIFGAFLELIWPTHYFNKKNNINNNLVRFRTYVETVVKLRLKNHNLHIFNKSILKYFYLKK